MNMSEKIGRLGPGPRVNLLSHGRENLQESNVLHDNFFFMTKKGTWRHQSRDQNILNVLVRF